MCIQGPGGETCAVCDRFNTYTCDKLYFVKEQKRSMMQHLTRYRQLVQLHKNVNAQQHKIIIQDRDLTPLTNSLYKRLKYHDVDVAWFASCTSYSNSNLESLKSLNF
jgi:hypothetical protein